MPRQNYLNDLTPKEWIRFQKSWFVHAPPRRTKGVVQHPGKFPETLAQEFIEFFTKRGGMVLDPMVGTGSTLLAAARSGRQAVGIELNSGFVDIAQSELDRVSSDEGVDVSGIRVIQGDARELGSIGLPTFDYCLTSPPYWDMLRRKGFEGQAERRARGLQVAYSEDEADLGNIVDYETFVDQLVAIYEQVHGALVPGGYLTIVVKNVKKGPRLYPLAWDLASRLARLYILKDEKIWCQDDQRLAPYGMFNAWVSNTHHHYCLILRKEPAR